MAKKIDYEVRCLRCGHIIRGRRGEDEHKKSFSCKQCSGQFSITFEHPSREDLEDAFLRGELAPDIRMRRRPIMESFPFTIFRKR